MYFKTKIVNFTFLITSKILELKARGGYKNNLHRRFIAEGPLFAEAQEA